MNPDFLPTAAQAIQMPGGGELLLILLIVLVVFGSNKIPQLGTGLGMGIRNFKRAISDKDDEKPAQNAESPPHAEANKSADKGQDANKML